MTAVNISPDTYYFGRAGTPDRLLATRDQVCKRTDPAYLTIDSQDRGLFPESDLFRALVCHMKGCHIKAQDVHDNLQGLPWFQFF